MMMEGLGIRISATEARIADAFRDQRRAVFVACSGGKDSLALLELCKPYAGRFKLLWMNAGRQFPHVEAMIRDLGERYGLVEIATLPGMDIASVWTRHGLPSEHFAVEDVLPAGEPPAVRLMPWPDCCRLVRWEPVARFLAEQTEPTLVLHGQRLTDGAPGNGMDAFPRPACVDILSPLREWSTADVMAFIEAWNVELPAHYSELTDSLDCWVCPANWMIPGKGDYARWMQREYPELAAVVRPGVERIVSELQHRAGRMAAVLKTAGG